ncbi:MAG: ROK family protein [Propionibacterium sp.]|nr:ROK family protein [Propionibacterium sp.]
MSGSGPVPALARTCGPAPLPGLAEGDYGVGIDIGGTKTRATAFNATAAVASARRPTQRGAQGILDTAEEVLEQVRRTQPSTAHLRAVGIGIPGVVVPSRGEVSHGVNVGIGPEPLALGPLLEERLGIGVHVENDVSAATIGAAHALGAGRDVALVSLGTGLAAGMVLEGVPRTGARGSAGEIGHLPYRLDGLPCPCGQRGCLELYASGSALARMWPPTGQGPLVADLLHRVDEGDTRALDVAQEWLGAVAHAVTVVGLGVDVATILVAGGVAEAGEPFLQALRGTLRNRAHHSDFLSHMDLASRLRLVPPDLEVATLGACLAALGAGVGG